MRLKRNSKILLAVLLLLSMVATIPITSEAVEPSQEEYSVIMQDTYDVFIGSKTPVDMRKGGVVYFVYTVKSVDKKATTAYQHGVTASDNNTERYLYEDGGVLQYSQNFGLLEEGYTYFMKFHITDAGMECVVVRAKGEERELVSLPEKYGDETDNYKYAGLWFGCGQVTAELSHVLCYDENGNDLGVMSTAADVPPNKAMQYDTKLQQSYEVSVSKGCNVALSNEKKTDSREIYFEYTVESSESMIYQTGVFSTKKMNINYPHDRGFLVYENFSDNLGNGYLLESGASYIVKVTKEENTLTSRVQKTSKGETVDYAFADVYGTYENDAPYVGLWFGEGVDYPVTFHLINMKCYDENGNNLGVRCNQGTVEIIHKGEKEDYTEVSGIYYSVEEDTSIQLFSDKTAKVTKNGNTKEITYMIWANTIQLDFESGKESFEYSPQRIYSDKIAYNRLNTYYVDFVTGTDEVIPIQRLDEAIGYILEKPSDPTKEGATFEGWVLSDGTEYEFGKVVSKSLTLYAKWSDGVEYQKVNGEREQEITPIVSVVCSLFLLVAAIVVSIVLARRGGKNSESKKEKYNG